MKRLCATMLTLTCIFCFSQKKQKKQITPSQIDAVFSKWNAPDKAGIAVGIVNDGEVMYTKGYGIANLEHHIAIHPETKFHIGDLAKEFTVYALLLLEERGQLSLQDDIRKYLPDLKPLQSPITIIQLIHHTSGINNHEAAKALAGWSSSDIFTKKQAYAMVLNQRKSLPKSGSVQWHSDAGFMILEDLIAEITKSTYEDFIKQEIFEPLGMKNSVFDTMGAVIDNKAEGYFTQNNIYINAHLQHSHTIVSDVYTTVEDMCLWAKELFEPKIGSKLLVKKFDNLSVVNGEEVEEVNTALYTGSHRYWDFRGVKKLYHIEVAGGYASKLIRYPDHDLALIVLGNDGVYNGHAATAATALFIEAFLEPMHDSSEEIIAEKLSKKQLKTFEATYWDEDNFSSRKIRVVNDTLRYVRGPGNESALVPISKSTFKMKTWGNVTVNFDTSTTPKKMTVKVGENSFHSVAYESDAAWTKELNDYMGSYYAADLDASYTLTLNDEKLVIERPKMGPIFLTPKTANQFSGSQRNFSALKFKKDTKGKITGFLLETSGIHPIWFEKENNDLVLNQ